MRYAMLLLTAGFVSLSPLAAQGPLPITPGQRVRISVENSRRRVTGALLSQDADSVRLQPDRGDAGGAVAQSRISGVEVSAGRHSNAAGGALAGLLGGGIFGAVLGASCEGDFVCPGAGPAAASLGLLGAVLGGVVGAFSHHETWQSVYQREVHVNLVTPVQGRGLGVGVRVAF